MRKDAGVLGGDWRAEDELEPVAEIPEIDRHDDVAFGGDHVAHGRERIAAIAEEIGGDQPLFRAEARRYEGKLHPAGDRRGSIGSLERGRKARVRAIGARHVSGLLGWEIS